MQQLNVANDRFNIRLQLAGLQPKDEQIADWQKNASEVLKPLITAAVDAKAKVTANGNALVDVIKLDTAADVLDAARDAYQQSRDDLDLAGLTVSFAMTREALTKRAAGDAGALAKIADLAKADATYIEGLKAAKAQAQQVRVLDRKRAAAGKDVETSLAGKPRGDGGRPAGGDVRR